MSSAAGLKHYAQLEPDPSTVTLPEPARARMSVPFRSLLKIAEVEAAGRIDTRWKLIDVRYDMRIHRKLVAGENGSACDGQCRGRVCFLLIMCVCYRKSLYAYRAVTTLECSPQTLSNVIMNTSHTKRWVPGTGCV